MEIYERKNPIKVGRLAGPNSKKLSKIGCFEQGKLIMSKQQIGVAQRPDGLMLDEADIDANLLDFLLENSDIDKHLSKMFYKTIKQIKKTQQRQNHAQFNKSLA